MKILLLHLSDIHIKTENDFILQRGKYIAATTFSHLPKVEAVFIILSGDIAWSGSKAQYNLATNFLQSIRNCLRQEQDIPVNFIVVPGNHDCDFSGRSSVRETILQDILQNGEAVIDDEKIELCTKVQSAFNEFLEDIEPNLNIRSKDRLWNEYDFLIKDTKIIFDCLNVSWMSQLNEKQGQLVFPIGRYKSVQDNAADLRILVLHHPLNWYIQESYHPLKNFVRSIANIIISGHEHIQGVGDIDDINSTKSVYIEGGVLQEHGGNIPEDSSFNIILIDLNEKNYLCELLIWDRKRYIPKNSGNAWSSFRNLPSKRQSEFEVNDNLQEFLNDPGANFSHPHKQKLSLKDVFIYPDLQELVEGKKLEKPISSVVLNELTTLRSGVLISGEEKVGKTSLLRELFSHYLNNDLVPVYLLGEDIKKASESDLQTYIDNAVKSQYGDYILDAFHQLPTAKKILLFDDVDRICINEKHLGRVLSFFAKCIPQAIFTASDLFALNEVIAPETSTALSTFRHFSIQQFGYALRFDLIRRWCEIGDVYSEPESDISARIDKAEKLINVAIGRNLVPSAPFYLLILLQSFEAGQQSEIQNSAFGYYYQYLISHSIQKISIRPEDWDEFFNYCAQLAWEFKEAKIRELDRITLRSFNDRYCKEYTAVDFNKRLTQLCDAKLLNRRGEYYSFSYPYIYYFFLAKYLAFHLEDTSVRNLIEHYCEHLYVREYANSVLFLSHFSKETFIIERISSVLRSVFSDQSPMQFGEDTTKLNELLDSTSRLVFHGGDVCNNRREVHKLKDRIDSQDDKENSPQKEVDGELEFPAKLNLLFKTVDILGQILKNYYGSIPNNRKDDLLGEVIKGPLRALRVFIDYISEHQEAIIREVEGQLDDHKKIPKNDRNKIARRITFNIIEILTFSFLFKASNAITHEHLKSVTRRVVQNNNSIAFKLVELGSLLDFPGAIPIGKIQHLVDEIKGNIFTHRLLEIFVLRHLYIFKTDERDKQRICSILGIKMERQRAIDQKTKNRKKLK